MKSSRSNGNSSKNSGGDRGDVSDTAERGGPALSDEPGGGGGDISEKVRRGNGELEEGLVGVVGEGKVSWHKNFCMPGITLCFKVV